GAQGIDRSSRRPCSGFTTRSGRATGRRWPPISNRSAPQRPSTTGNPRMSESALTGWVTVWLIAALWTLARHWRGASAGLVFTYVLSLAVIHWLAPAMYLLPWFDNVRIDLTLAGLRESLFAI